MIGKFKYLSSLFFDLSSNSLFLKCLFIGVLGTGLSACSLSSDNNRSVASSLPMPMSMKPATSQQKQILLDYAAEAHYALALVNQSPSEMAEVFLDIKAYAPPTTAGNPIADYFSALELAKTNCQIRKTENKSEDVVYDRTNAGMTDAIQVRPAKTKGSLWSDSVNSDIKTCGYQYAGTIETTASLVPGQGTLSTAGKTLSLDLSGVKEKLTQNDVLRVMYQVGTKGYAVASQKKTSGGNVNKTNGLSQSLTSGGATLILVNGIQVNLQVSDSSVIEETFLDDVNTRITGTRTLAFIANMPVGDLAYEKKIQYLENGKTKTRIVLNGDVIFEK